MADQNDSLSVLQSVAANKQAAPAQSTPQQSQPQDSLSVLQSLNGGSAPVNMVGPQGEKVQVPQNQVADMRTKNFAVTPDNPDVQKMVTVDGKIAYVLPNEVTNFEDQGGTHILPDGRFLVKNMRSDNTDFPDSVPDVRERAVKVAKALSDEGTMQKSIEAEKKFWTSKEGLKQEAKGALNVALVGGGTLAALAGPGLVSAAAEAAPEVVGAGLRYLGRAALPGMEEMVGKQILLQAGKTAGKWVLGKALDLGGLGILGKIAHWW